jgi:hypothetical protein
MDNAAATLRRIAAQAAHDAATVAAILGEPSAPKEQAPAKEKPDSGRLRQNSLRLFRLIK